MKTDSIIRKQSGASAVEFAIILPLFLLIIFGIVEWSLYLFNRHIITDASRRGARFGIVQASPRVTVDEIRQKVLDYSSDHLVTFGTPAAPTVAVYKNGVLNDNCEISGNDLGVNVSYNYRFLVFPALARWILPQTPFIKTITANTVMKCE